MIYKTSGTCSSAINLEVEGDIIKSVSFTGGSCFVSVFCLFSFLMRRFSALSSDFSCQLTIPAYGLSAIRITEIKAIRREKRLKYDLGMQKNDE